MQVVKTVTFMAALVLAGCGTPQSADANATLPDSGANNGALSAETAPTASSSDPATVDNVGSANAAGEAEAIEPATQAAAAGTAQPLPADVVAFRAKRDECDHFRGEEPTDEARGAFLAKALERTCTGTDAALARLRKRYAGTPAVIAVLADYENEVE